MVLISAFLALALQTAAPAGPLDADQQFARADANKDGRVDKAELKATLVPDAQPFVDAVWDNRDRDRNGWLSKEELTFNGAQRTIGRAGAPPPPARAGTPTPK